MLSQRPADWLILYVKIIHPRQGLSTPIVAWNFVDCHGKKTLNIINMRSLKTYLRGYGYKFKNFNGRPGVVIRRRLTTADLKRIQSAVDRMNADLRARNGPTNQIFVGWRGENGENALVMYGINKLFAEKHNFSQCLAAR